MIITGEQRPEYFRFASDILQEPFEWPHCKCITTLSNTGEILGVVVYSQTTLTNCMMSVASDGTGRFLSRAALYEFFALPFIQWGKPRVTTLIRPSNTHSINFNRKIGFIQEGIVRRAYGDEDGILFGMLKEECRFLNYKR